MSPRAQRLKLQKLKKVFALLEQNVEFPNVRVRIYDRERELVETRSEEATKLHSESRMEYVLKFVNIRGEAYLQLVNDLKSQKAFEILMNDLVPWAWEQFSGFPIDILPPLRPGTKESQHHTNANRIIKMAHHWIMEGYRRLDSLKEKSMLAADGATSGTAIHKAPDGKSLSEKLDEAALHEDISHEEQAHRIGLSRTTYFEVKTGRGGKKARTKTALYLSRVFSNTYPPKPD
jgi:hypothetical protein